MGRSRVIPEGTSVGTDNVNWTIRAEEPADVGAISEVVRSAFGDDETPCLVELIRDRDESLVSLVALSDGKVIGHVMVSPITLAGRSDQFGGAAPLSVVPLRQRTGVGSALMLAMIDACRALGLKGLFLLGSPAYYPRFGFTRSHIGNDYDATDAFMHLSLEPGCIEALVGDATYVSAFAESGA